MHSQEEMKILSHDSGAKDRWPKAADQGQSLNDDDPLPPTRIAFGSCNDQGSQNNMWPRILERKPAAFIWGGDAIYADEKIPPVESAIRGGLRCAGPDRVRRLYRQQRQVPGYKALLDSNITIYGTIDDHDYGCNNADKTFQHKVANTKAFVQDFLQLSKAEPMSIRVAQGKGVYGVQLYDFVHPDRPLIPSNVARLDAHYSSWAHNRTQEEYVPSDRSIAVFVLDVRTNKDPWKQGSQTYETDYEGDFLGEEQWQWLETSLSRSRAAINVVVNGLQVQGDLNPNPNIAEAWTKFPYSQQRLFHALLQAEGTPVLISGDVHMTQLMKTDCQGITRSNNATVVPMSYRSIVEMTTSGMTHSWGELQNPPYDAGKAFPKISAHDGENVDAWKYASWQERLESLSSRLAMHWMHFVNPWNAIMVNDGTIAPESKLGLQYSLRKNFGEIEVDWESRVLQIRSIGESGKVLLETNIDLSADETHSRSLARSRLSNADFQAEYEQRHLSPLGASYPDSPMEWVCLPHRGRVTSIHRAFGHVASVMGIALLPVCLLLWLLFVGKRRSRPAHKTERLASSTATPIQMSNTMYPTHLGY